MAFSPGSVSPISSATPHAYAQQQQRYVQSPSPSSNQQPQRFSKKILSQTEDHGHHYGNFWFAGGSIPDTHVVGQAYPRVATPDQRAAAGNSIEGPLVSSSNAVPHYHDISAFLAHQHDGTTPSSKVMPSPFTAPRSQTPPASSNRRHEPGAWAASSPGVPISMMSVPSPSTVQRGGGIAAHSPRHSDAHAPPFAEHYPIARYARSMISDGDSVRLRATAHNTTTGLPRGYGGLDIIPAAARQAQRAIEEMQQDVSKVRKAELQRALKEDLDRQVKEKQRRKLQEWQAEAVAVYGPALALSDDSRRIASKQKHVSLKNVWDAQAAELAQRKAAEDAYYKPYEENWNDMKDHIERLRRDGLEDRVQQRQSSWLEAWKDHQAAEGAQRKAQLQEQHRREYEEIAPHIANYADRILLSEQQRQEQQRQYRQELDRQVAQRQAERFQALVQEHEEDLYGTVPTRRV